MNRFVRRLAVVFFALGVLQTVVAGWWVIRARAFVARAETAPGAVVALERSTSRDSSAYHPVVRFKSPSGQERTFRSPAGSNPPSHAVGDAVDVLYDPADLADARIDSRFSLWGGPIIGGSMALVFGGVGGGILLAA